MVDKLSNDSCRLLIIDDNINIYNDFQTILLERMDTSEIDMLAAEYFGESVNPSANIRYELDYAAQGEEGVEKIRQALQTYRPFALSFVDMRMPPGWDGLETAEHIWKLDPDVQIVICTAYSDYSWDEITRRLGRTDQLLILKKPFDTAEVAQLASALTQKWILKKQASLKMSEIEQMIKDRTQKLSLINLQLEQEIIEREKTEKALRISNQKILEQQKSVIEEERLKIMLQLSGATAYELNQPISNLIENIQFIKNVRNNSVKMDHHIALIEEIGKKIFNIVERIQTIPFFPSHASVSLSGKSNERVLKILSIEDSAFDFEFLKTLLKKNSQIILSHEATIKEGLQILETDTIDLVLLDYLLPDGNGLDFLKTMNSRGNETPVVVITGEGDEMVASQAIQAGAYEYLPKDKISVQSLNRIILNTLEKARLKREVKEAQKIMAKMSTTDELTTLYNRRYFEEFLEREVSRAKRYNTGLVLCMADIDHFKNINDTYSHLAGDMVLSKVGELLRKYYRESDLICRYGGEEFAIILPNTDLNNAVKACEKFRKVLSKNKFDYNSNQFNITISIGLASYNTSLLNSHKAFIGMADKALYQAKNSGRNAVVVYAESD